MFDNKYTTYLLDSGIWVSGNFVAQQQKKKEIWHRHAICSALKACRTGYDFLFRETVVV